ncbi:MAG TPA: hypothetical protein VM598_13890 [Bdellovibrionota bacterium]|nr:hypothetical protein [Bdellovibrionota bacterium]
MSATRDKSQKITFVFSNFYHLYKKGVDAAKSAELPEVPAREVPASERVLKAGDANAELAKPFAVNRLNAQADPAAAGVREHRPAEFIGKRIAKPPVLPPSTAIVSLRENLKSLTDLHSRLRFMLQELEDLVKDKA